MSLAISYDELRREIGRAVNYGRSGWNSTEETDIDDILKSGLRKAYYHQLIDGQQHPWSFLRPVMNFDLTTGKSTYDLPENFEELLDEGLAFAANSNEKRVSRVAEWQIRSLKSEADRSGTPQYCAVRPKVASDDDATRYEIIFYPTPDEDVQLTGRVVISPPAISSTNRYPMGGAVHSEMILEACLAAAEEKLDDTQGVHSKRFLECLAASIEIDKRYESQGDGVWPLEHPADGLGINKAYLKRLIGREMKYGPHQGTWSHKQSSEVELGLQTGLRKFYDCPILPGEREKHQWSFLNPLETVTTVSGVWRYDLPEHVAYPDGPLLFAPGSSVIYPPIELVSEHQVRTRLQYSTSTGRPTIAAVQIKPLDDVGGTRLELLLAPAPNGEYSIKYRYRVNPNGLRDDVQLPYGGQAHAQTIIEACLCAAEEVGGIVNGPHSQKFIECLRSSVSHDRRASSPSTLGRSRPPSDGPYDSEILNHDCDENIVTYNGVAY